ncbi:MAG: stage III sporulation protein AB [Oscillospiraceae bacterium]|nr:stage III sporulation protein AB [Oscillospiraceae bacterium]
MEWDTGRFEQAAELLPREMRYALMRLTAEEMAAAEEIRLRAGRGLSVVCGGEERFVVNGQGLSVYPGDLDMVLQLATQASAHTALERVRGGFVTVRGGHRIGICGTAVVRDGVIANLDRLSSLSIRIAREVRSAAAMVLPEIHRGGVFESTLLISPPGVGKTTLLRDIIRRLSSGEGCAPVRVGLADERGEVAAMYDGQPQMEVGPRTDVMDACPKAEGLLMLLRGMNPQVLAADEITAPADCGALEMAANCGVKLLATAHAATAEELARRPLYRALLAQRVFKRLVVIRAEGRDRVYTVEPVPEPE